MRIAQVSYHTNPVAPLGGRHTGGMNVYVHELSRELARLGNQVDIFTRLEGELPELTTLAPNLRLVQLPAGPAAPLDKALLTPYVPAFVAEMNRFAADASWPPPPTRSLRPAGTSTTCSPATTAPTPPAWSASPAASTPTASVPATATSVGARSVSSSTVPCCSGWAAWRS